MKALVIGCGSMGLRHVAHLRQLGISRIEAADTDPNACRRAREQFGIVVWRDAGESLQRSPDIVLICTPATQHVPMALKALDAGAHVFIEKPLSTNFDGVDLLATKARRSGKVVQVGYNLRYHPAFKAMRRLVESGAVGKILTAHAEFGLHLAKWWPRRDYRTSYMANSRLGGGLVFDVSHELDALVWFLGEAEEVAAYGGKLSALEIQGADTVRAVLKMASGAIASLHIDCLQPTYTRTFSLIGDGTCLRWDCPRGRVDRSLGRMLLFDAKSNRYKRVELDGRPEDTYVEELRDFVRCVDEGTAPSVSLEDGVAALRLALAIQNSVDTGRVTSVRIC